MGRLTQFSIANLLYKWYCGIGKGIMVYHNHAYCNGNCIGNGYVNGIGNDNDNTIGYGNGNGNGNENALEWLW